MQIWPTLLSALERDDRAALVTIVAIQGSTPREAGARMVVGPDRRFSGSIGGGALELAAIDEAAARLAGMDRPGTLLRSQALGPELGQCCGGRVDLLFETFDREAIPDIAPLAERERSGIFRTEGRITPAGVERHVVAESSSADVGATAVLRGDHLTETFGDQRRALYLFGAGHVGRALVLALAPLPFDVTWLDSRPDAFPAHLPPRTEAVHLDNPEVAVAAAPWNSFGLVMTHSHQLDLEIVRALLSDSRFAYVGLIGSATKRARFVRQLTEAGLAAARIDELVCPIGIAGIRSKHPAAIAAATVAELLTRDEALAAGQAPVWAVG